jgi:hypothetical protein
MVAEDLGKVKDERKIYDLAIKKNLHELKKAVIPGLRSSGSNEDRY